MTELGKTDAERLRSIAESIRKRCAYDSADELDRIAERIDPTPKEPWERVRENRLALSVFYHGYAMDPEARDIDQALADAAREGTVDVKRVREVVRRVCVGKINGLLTVTATGAEILRELGIDE